MDLYLQGLASLNRGVNPANMAQARGFFERAVALDPNNLDALLAKVGRVELAYDWRGLSVRTTETHASRRPKRRPLPRSAFSKAERCAGP